MCAGIARSAERAGRMPGRCTRAQGADVCSGDHTAGVPTDGVREPVDGRGPSRARPGHSPSAGRAGSMLGQEPCAHGADACSGFVACGFKLLDQVAADLHWVSARVLGRAHVES